MDGQNCMFSVDVVFIVFLYVFFPIFECVLFVCFYGLIPDSFPINPRLSIRIREFFLMQATSAAGFQLTKS